MGMTSTSLLSYNPDAVREAFNNDDLNGIIFEFVFIGADDADVAVLNRVVCGTGGLMRVYDLPSGFNLLYGFIEVNSEWILYTSEPGFFTRQVRGTVVDVGVHFQGVTKSSKFDVCWVPGSGVRRFYKSLMLRDVKPSSLKTLSKLMLVGILVGVNGPVFQLWEV